MKKLEKIKNILLILPVLLLVLGSCEDDPYFIDPTASFEISTLEPELFERVFFTNTGAGEFYSIYTGEPGHVYGDSLSTGHKTDNTGDFSYTYLSTGTFEVVFIATSYKDGGIVESIARKTITVSEGNTGTAIEKVNFLNENSPGGNFLGYINIDSGGSKFIQEARIIENNISIEVYQPFRVLKTDFSGYMTTKGDYAFLPNIELNSPTAFVEIDGVGDFENMRTEVNHTDDSGENFVPVTYSVVTNSGTRNDYTAVVMCIPEFSGFSVEGIAGTVRTNQYNYNRFSIDIEVPAATDLSSLTPVFSCYGAENTKVYIDDVEQSSNSGSVDFSSGPVEYELIYTEPGFDNEFQVRSYITVTVAIESEP